MTARPGEGSTIGQNRCMTKWRAFPARTGRSHPKRYGQLLLAASVTILMAGCGPYWAGSGDTFVEYSGSDRGKVQACADFSADSEHGASAEGPLYEVVTDIQVEPADHVWEISGTTLLVKDEDEYLDWSCRVTVDVDSRTMHAELVDVGPGQEVSSAGRPARNRRATRSTLKSRTISSTVIALCRASTSRQRSLHPSKPNRCTQR